MKRKFNQWWSTFPQIAKQNKQSSLTWTYWTQRKPWHTYTVGTPGPGLEQVQNGSNNNVELISCIHKTLLLVITNWNKNASLLKNLNFSSSKMAIVAPRTRKHKSNFHNMIKTIISPGLIIRIITRCQCIWNIHHQHI